MAEKRFSIQGFRDYRGVQLPDIIEDLKGHRDDLEKIIEEFKLLKTEVKKNTKRLDDSDEIEERIDYIISLFGGHWEDLKRLSDELPFGVKAGHIETVREIYESCLFENKEGYRSFKNEFICRELKDESLRGLLDRVCTLYGSTAFSFLIFNAIKSRLQIFLKESPPMPVQGIIPAIEKEKQEAKIRAFRTQEGTTWEDVHLIFEPGGIMKIEVKGRAEERSFAECGLSDRRSDEKGSLLLSLLINLSENKGKIEGKYLNVYSGRKRPVIPVQSGHLFRFKAATDSG
jgi:regulator of replication initiation timing